jgi:hypothetical protein
MMQKRLLKNRTSQNGYYNSVRDLNRMVAHASIQTKTLLLALLQRDQAIEGYCGHTYTYRECFPERNPFPEIGG